MTETMVLPTDKKILSTTELFQLGMTYYRIKKLEAQGHLIKLNKSMYENLDYTGEESDYIYVYAYVPDGIVCLLTAASIYELTNFRIESIDVAVNRKKYIKTLPEYPLLQLHYFDEKRLTLGISEMSASGEKVKIFDIEKTVVDIISFKNKIGIEETKEIITNYLRRSDRNINKLCRYAKQLKCKKILDSYLEVLV
ncbi:MAG: hypothetical protein WC162_03230 [Sphaerochaetaceae bacterium]|nr:hypothetical protein [Sphaerochaetaceae bacterium]